MSVCTKYPGSCKVETEFCARRYQKATFNPDDFSLEPCRTCADGKEAFGIWKDSFKDKENGRGKRFTDGSAITKKPYKCRFCETPTSSADRICLKCQIEGKKELKDVNRDRNPLSGKAVDRDRSTLSVADTDTDTENGHGLFGQRITVFTEKEDIMGTKVCEKCGTPASSNAQPACKECGVLFGKKGRKISQASRERVPRQQKADQLPRESEPETYTIAVDFSRFPKLHQRLMKMADDEIRKPGDQLLFMLKNTLVQLEERA